MSEADRMHANGWMDGGMSDGTNGGMDGGMRDRANGGTSGGTSGGTEGWRAWAALATVAVLAGCAGAPSPKPPPAAQEQAACRQAAQGDAWVGNWLGVDKRKGITGELHVLITLRQDGTMAYAEQLKRRSKLPQTLSETGCWHRDGETLVMRTTHSNGVPVEQGDPIYTNTYAVKSRAGQLALSRPEGLLTLKRMPNDYRLPF